MTRLSKHPCSELKTAQAEGFGVLLPDPMLDWVHTGSGDLVIVCRADSLGDPAGPVELGRHLLSAFLEAVVAFTPPPAALILYSTAVRMTLPDSEHLENLKKLAATGTEILLCRASLEHLNLTGESSIGRACDWNELADRMRKAAKVLWP